MSDVDAYALIWTGIMVGVGIGWLGGGLSSHMRPRTAFLCCVFWIACSFGVRPLIDSLVIEEPTTQAPPSGADQP